MPTLAETLAAGVDELSAFNALLQQYLDALAALEQNVVSYEFWVDPVSGDNTNDGLAAATALQTINAAINKTPPGSYVLVNLLSDYTMEANVTTGGRIIRIRGRSAANAATQRIFTQTVSGGAARRLLCQDGGSYQLNNLDIVPAKTAVTSGPTAFVSGRLKTLFLLDCGIDVEAGVTTVSVMGQDGVAILEVDTVTALDDTLAGHWIEGITAGTNPNTLGKVLTNLATL